MIKSVIAIIVALLIIVIGLGVYLGPNDLGRCDATPNGVDKCIKVDAIITVSGGDTPARASEAIKLFKNGWSDRLIFSGAAQDKTGPSNAEAMRRQAIKAGVPTDAILTESNSDTTRQNAEQTQALLTKNNIRTIILVTSAYHQRRASLEFDRSVGGTVKILNHPVPQDDQWSNFWWVTPIGWWLAIGEFFKIIIFYLGGSL